MYKIQYTEKNNAKANDYETRALLYLLAMRDDSDDISIFFIDSLNDLTGSSDDCQTLWDTQSKGVSSLNPTKIGFSLITLLDNYLSEIDFIHSILLIPKIKEGYLINEDLKNYHFNNFKDNKKSYLIDGLKKEYKRRNNITSISSADEDKINSFIDKVLFVVGDEKEVYIKNIIQFKNKESLSLKFYTSIFDEIRNKQSSLKNIYIEDVIINHPSEIIKYDKHLKSNDIKIMVLNRFIATELFKPNYIPINYHNEVKELDSEDLKDLLQENNSNISRTFFDKNNKISFWRLLENITNIISNNPNKDIRFIYSKLNKNLVKKNHNLSKNSTLFFTSLIMDGINNAN